MDIPISMRSIPSQSRAFTLVELLVSVAIIAILMAMILTAIKPVRMKAQIAQNLGNLRFIQAANIAYAYDHNGVYVPVATWDDQGQGTYWFNNKDFRLNYIGLKTSSSPWPDKMLSPLSTMRDSAGRRLIERSYGYNFTGLGGVFGTPSLARQTAFLQVLNPGSTLAFADGLDWQIQMSGADRYAGREETLQNGIAYRYEGKAGVVYFDGHAEMLSRQDVVNNQLLWQIRNQ